VVPTTVPRLVACPSCHAQLDASGVRGESILCHCGARVPNTAGVDVPVERCGTCGATVEPGTEKCRYCGAAFAGVVGPLLCPECFARNAAGARFCTSCGVELHAQPAVGDGPRLACPACSTDLTPRSIAGLGVEECAACRGLWVPAANFDRLVAQVRDHREIDPSAGLAPPTTTRPASAPTIVYRKCPVCRQVMTRKNFARISGVIVDWCGAHGTWLDANELGQIAAFVAAGGMQRAEAQQKDDERVAASMQTFDRLVQTGGDATHLSVLDVLTTILK